MSKASFCCNFFFLFCFQMVGCGGGVGGDGSMGFIRKGYLLFLFSSMGEI